ncbi:lysophospholipid acyltransferase family protein [Opitutales bacterium ASA1]|uniref:lysophospholipid acyltransferase family protein n=1 Tax=Congregicoccus parvus TaxID=3081749 RepID=UPI002B2F4F54|nr:lysophospholipid acyltransferase family protein [Opitutales bacterium ASA1]
METLPAIASAHVTPMRHPSLLARTMPGAVFYGRLASIVWRASRKARNGRYDDRAWIASSLEVVEAIEAIGGRIVVENVDAIARLTGPAVIVGNHMSTLETFVLPSVIGTHRRLTFVVKRELVEMPVFKHVMISRNPVVVGRAHAREDLKTMLEEGEARLRAGISLVVFPQTTRAASFTPAEFNSIAVKIAKRADVPVVPLALRTDLWGIGTRIKDCGTIQPDLPVRFAFGEPMRVQGNGREAHEAVVRFVSDRLTDWGVPVRGGDASPSQE